MAPYISTIEEIQIQSRIFSAQNSLKSWAVSTLHKYITLHPIFQSRFCDNTSFIRSTTWLPCIKSHQTHTAKSVSTSYFWSCFGSDPCFLILVLPQLWHGSLLLKTSTWFSSQSNDTLTRKVTWVRAEKRNGLYRTRTSGKQATVENNHITVLIYCPVTRNNEF